MIARGGGGGVNLPGITRTTKSCSTAKKKMAQR